DGWLGGDAARPVRGGGRGPRGGDRHVDLDGAGGRRAGPGGSVPAVPGEQQAARRRGSGRDRAALPAGAPRRGDHRRGDGRAGERRLRRGGEPAARPEGLALLAGRRTRAGHTVTSPATRTARHARITALIRQRPVRSQTELADLLAAEGMAVTQATLSR